MHRLEHRKILERISNKLTNLPTFSATLLEAVNHTHPSDKHLWVVFSKKNRQDHWSEWNHSNSYMVHMYNAEDNGFYQGYYDLSLEFAQHKFEDRKQRYCAEFINVGYSRSDES